VGPRPPSVPCATQQPGQDQAPIAGGLSSSPAGREDATEGEEECRNPMPVQPCRWLCCPRARRPQASRFPFPPPRPTENKCVEDGHSPPGIQSPGRISQNILSGLGTSDFPLTEPVFGSSFCGGDYVLKTQVLKSWVCRVLSCSVSSSGKWGLHK